MTAEAIPAISVLRWYTQSNWRKAANDNVCPCPKSPNPRYSLHETMQYKPRLFLHLRLLAAAGAVCLLELRDVIGVIV
jgi:hypothetical protein